RSRGLALGQLALELLLDDYASTSQRKPSNFGLETRDLVDQRVAPGPIVGARHEITIFEAGTPEYTGESGSATARTNRDNSFTSCWGRLRGGRRAMPQGPG